MKKSVFALAALGAVALSGAAFAEEGKTATRPAAMTDSEMDKVTAGEGLDPAFRGLGAETAAEASGKTFNSPRWYPNKGHGTANITGNPHLIGSE